MKRVSVLVASSVLFAVSGSPVEAAQVVSREGCVNLRSQPSSNAGVIRCLPSGTNIEPDRIAPSGRFVWKKEGDRVWYYTSVPGTAEKGWIMPDCTDINGVNKGTCADTGSAAPLANPQQPQTIAQSEQKEEVLQNTNWQIVPGAKVGNNPVETRLNVNGINKINNLVTFDITGYQGSYYRLQGDCGTRQVGIVRRGLQARANDVRNSALKVSYQSVEGEESKKVTPWHQNLLDFACRQPGTQIASSPVGASAEAVGNVQCRGIMRGSPVNSNPIQKAMLEPIAGGYIFRFTEVVQGQPRERVWNLSNLLIVKNVRSYDPDQSITPIKIQSTGAFSKTIMPSSREECTFAGTLQFIGNAQAQLFDGSSNAAALPGSVSQIPSSTAVSPPSSSQSASDTPLQGATPVYTYISPIVRCRDVYTRVMAIGETRTCRCVGNERPYGPHGDYICLAAVKQGLIPNLINGALVTIEIPPSASPHIGTTPYGGLIISKSVTVKSAEVKNPVSERLRRAREIAHTLQNKYLYWSDNLPFCPCTLAAVQASSQFENARTPSFLLKKYHPGAEFDYRSREFDSVSGKRLITPYSSITEPNAPKLMPGQQCTYATNPRDGVIRLITGGAGAATPDAYSPSATLPMQGLVSDNSHTFWDVEPFDAMYADNPNEAWEEYQENWTMRNRNACPEHIVPTPRISPQLIPPELFDGNTIVPMR